MGYLQLDVSSNPDFTMNKAAVSFWFRIPATSGSEVRARDDVPISGNAILWGVVPLLMFGTQGANGEGPYGPSWIGVFFDPVFGSPPALSVNIQTNDFSADFDFPAYFGNGNNDFFAGQPRPVATDVWHHLLLSWDIGSGNSASGNSWSSSSVMNCILDRTVRAGVNNLPATCLDNMTPSGPSNGMLCWPVYKANGNEDASYSVGFSKVPCNPIFVPGVEVNRFDQSVGNLQVEMAELQIYSNLLLDSSSLGLFVTDAGKPAEPTAAILALGKRPEIMLRGKNDWISGTNAGTMASFEPTGTITEFTPDPSL